jgi:hypothetical protein
MPDEIADGCGISFCRLAIRSLRSRLVSGWKGEVFEKTLVAPHAP